MKRFFLEILLIAAIAAPFSCSRKVEGGFDTIGYVDHLMADSLFLLKNMAASAGKPSGTITLIGDPRTCLLLSESMMACDYFDNIDARDIKDGLPDFAGETITSVLDFAHLPYSSLAASDQGRLVLRERAVRMALAAIDTSCVGNPAKILIVCSPDLAEYGGDDISDLFEKTGCDVPVIYSTDSTFSFEKACFSLMREKSLFTHDIAYPSARGYMMLPDSLGPPFRAIPFSDGKVPANFPDTVGVLAPNTYVSYVQNQY